MIVKKDNLLNYDIKDTLDINTLVCDIRDVFEITLPILDMKNIVTTLGGTVEFNTENKIIDFPVIQKDGSTFKVKLNSEQSAEQCNYKIAQALGYLFLNLGYIIDEDTWFRLPDKEYSFITADHVSPRDFALNFLLPEDEFRRVIDQFTINKTVQLKKVASYFGVPVNVIWLRGVRLGILSDL